MSHRREMPGRTRLALAAAGAAGAAAWAVQQPLDKRMFRSGYDDTDLLSGDVVLCAPVIAAQARSQHKTLEAHYAHLVVHGMLHLQGYDHDSEDEAVVMEARETEILGKLRYPDPYAVAS